ncbi:GrpB family protein [Pseudonocardia phyllosphaerae]|uniref:GrpB family protein n=1 Tax=Pseudonocardia phyllosphaerae TaxID=3390502 RepID=UPI00397979AF
MIDRVEIIGGPEQAQIVVVDYDPAWLQRFAVERLRIVDALGHAARRVDHVGSTSVPGLAAKPVVDIDVSVDDVNLESSYLPALVDAGYVLRVREPGHRQLRTPGRDVNVHVCTIGSDWERDHLLFRDWLRRDAADRETYGRFKKDLATRDWESVGAYSAAKSDLIAEILGRARDWAHSVHWAVPADHADGR